MESQRIISDLLQTDCFVFLHHDLGQDLGHDLDDHLVPDPVLLLPFVEVIVVLVVHDVGVVVVVSLVAVVARIPYASCVVSKPDALGAGLDL